LKNKKQITKCLGVLMAKINRIKITVLKRFSPSEVFKTSPVTPVDVEAFGACEMFKEGQEFIVENLKMPEGFCTMAWMSISGNVRILSFGNPQTQTHH